MNAEYLTYEEFDSAFDELYAGLRERFWKVETLQYYAEPESDAFAVLAKGQWAEACQLGRANAQTSTERYGAMRERGISIRRLRKAVLPLTNYTRLELEIYLVLNAIGAEIAVQPITEQSTAPQGFAFARDCLIFDSAAILVHEYLGDGVLAGGWILRDPEAVASAADAFRRGFDEALPVEDFYREYVQRFPGIARH